MAVLLEGGCRVSEMREGAPFVDGSLRIWRQINREAGAQAISLRVLQFAPGLSPGIRNAECDELIYILEGEATFLIDGRPLALQPETGVYLRPGETLTVDNPGPGPLVSISSQCPEPRDSPMTVPPLTAPRPGSPATPEKSFVRLADRRALPTADRWYRVLVDEELGSTRATQFVGSIPKGRAPDHFHHYEEALFILRGAGRMWSGQTHTDIGPGSCIYLPRGQVHCVENTGMEELRLLGVFYPAGSPAVRYDAE